MLLAHRELAELTIAVMPAIRKLVVTVASRD